ncbi:hypothetical protein B0H13DRAFT_1863104 [Mycena leptocephala]|nr:hypothetical protein B0H13DRAFT_1863104 [Mycena leptocephala]
MRDVRYMVPVQGPKLMISLTFHSVSSRTLCSTRCVDSDASAPAGISLAMRCNPASNTVLLAPRGNTYCCWVSPRVPIEMRTGCIRMSREVTAREDGGLDATRVVEVHKESVLVIWTRMHKKDDVPGYLRLQTPVIIVDKHMHEGTVAPHEAPTFGDVWELRLDVAGGHFEEVDFEEEARVAEVGFRQRAFRAPQRGRGGSAKLQRACLFLWNCVPARRMEGA